MLMTTLLLAPFALQYAQAQTTEGQVTISGTCGLGFVSGAPIVFGTLARDVISSEQTLVLNNTGSVTSTVQVNGTNWVSGATTHIDVAKTKFATSDQGAATLYAAKTPLSATLAAFGTIKPTPVTNSTYWMLETTLQNLPFSGALTQEITFSVTC